MRMSAIAFGIIFLVLAAVALAEGAAALPDWLARPITERKVSSKILAIFEASYDDQRAFVFVTGVEDYELLDERGKSICEYGGFAGQVRSGSCNPHKVVLGRTVYPQR